jgi:hypothetical protein
MNELPEEDGYYWVKITDHNMNSIYIERNKFIIVELKTDPKPDSKGRTRRYIRFLERLYHNSGKNNCRVKYFLERADFTEFLKIDNPN